MIAGGLAGCASSSPTAEPTESPTVPAPSTESSSAAEQEVDQAAADPATCLHGTWLADNAFFLAALSEFGDEAQSVDGRVVLQLDADGTLTTDYQGWTITFIVEGEEARLERSGVDRGTFSAAESSVSVAEADMGSTVTLYTPEGDLTIAPDRVNYVDAPYTCGDDRASVTTPDGVLELTRS